MSSERDPVFGCVLVTSRLDPEGYAYHGKSRAHIVAWTAKHGPVPDGKELDHLCRRRNCKAVHHLELVDRVENERRKSWSYMLRKSHCSRGHDMTLYRQVTPERGVVCRMCNRQEKAIE